MGNKAKILLFPTIGKSEIGFLTIAEKYNLPFVVKRVYWTYYTPNNVERGRHAHKDLEQIIVSVNGNIVINTEDLEGNKEEFILDNPNTGLYLPNTCWRTMKFSHSAVLLCLASHEFEEKDYVRSYEEFKKLQNESKG